MKVLGSNELWSLRYRGGRLFVFGVGGSAATSSHAVNDFRKGKEASIGFLIGQVQKEAKGQADANLTRRLLLEKLK